MSKATKGLPVLYSRRTDGKTHQWQIEVRSDCYRTISGLVDGQKVTSEWTIARPKNVGRSNATSGEAQAEVEARAAWKKRIEEGYTENEDDVDEASQRFYQVMLAEHYDDYGAKVELALANGEKVFCQPKLDGMRCVCDRTGMWSRRGKPIVSAPHIKYAIVKAMGEAPGATWRMDGELYADKFAADFNAIIKLAKKQKPSDKDLAESAKHLEYHVYDMPSAPGTFGKRQNTMASWVSSIGAPLVLVETLQISSTEDIDRLFGQWRARGYEGAMIRLDRPYENKRSQHLLKYKQFQEEEFKVLDVVEGIGNRSGMAGYMKFETAAGRAFSAALMGNVDFFRRVLKDRKRVIGKMATVQFQMYTPDGSPRFPCVKALRDYE